MGIVVGHWWDRRSSFVVCQGCLGDHSGITSQPSTWRRLSVCRVPMSRDAVGTSAGATWPTQPGPLVCRSTTDHKKRWSVPPGDLMRILLAQNSLYYPAHGGGDKSNRLLLEALAARGHVCQVVARLSVFAEQAAAFAPDVILVSTDDPAQLLLTRALGHATARVVYLARATLALPFGPDCAFPSQARTERIRACDAVDRKSVA